MQAHQLQPFESFFFYARTHSLTSMASELSVQIFGEEYAGIIQQFGDDILAWGNPTLKNSITKVRC